MGPKLRISLTNDSDMSFLFIATNSRAFFNKIEYIEREYMYREIFKLNAAKNCNLKLFHVLEENTILVGL